MNTSDFVSFLGSANYGLRLWRLRSQPQLPSARLAPHVCAWQSNCTKSSRPPATWERQFSNKKMWHFAMLGNGNAVNQQILSKVTSLRSLSSCSMTCHRFCLYINDMCHLGNNRRVEAFSRRSDSVKCQIWQRCPFNYENKKWLKWPEMIETTTALKLKLLKWFSNDPISVCTECICCKIHKLQRLDKTKKINEQIR